MFHFTHFQLFFTIVILLFGLGACSSGSKQTAVAPPTEEAVVSPPPKPARPANEAPVKGILIRTSESFPIQVNVLVRGELPDSCTTLDQFLQERLGNTFVLQILTSRASQQACSQVIQPFDQVIPLEVDDLKAGVYTVKVNGVTESFTLGMDNVRKR